MINELDTVDLLRDLDDHGPGPSDHGILPLTLFDTL
jgi:hypothetical protein